MPATLFAKHKVYYTSHTNRSLVSNKLQIRDVHIFSVIKIGSQTKASEWKEREGERESERETLNVCMNFTDEMLFNVYWSNELKFYWLSLPLKVYFTLSPSPSPPSLSFSPFTMFNVVNVKIFYSKVVSSSYKEEEAGQVVGEIY